VPVFAACSWVFFEVTGERSNDIGAAWKAACKKAKLESRVPHNFRRIVVRNMAGTGVPERVAMAISGPKTRGFFDRYNILNEDDLKKASHRVKEYHQEMVILKNGHSLGTAKAQQGLETQPEIH
jgi:integrase